MHNRTVYMFFNTLLLKVKRSSDDLVILGVAVYVIIIGLYG